MPCSQAFEASVFLVQVAEIAFVAAKCAFAMAFAVVHGALKCACIGGIN